MQISMIGLGKLGLPVANVISKHFKIVGYDIVDIKANFTIANSIEECIKDSDLILVAAPTPHDPEYGGEKPTSHLPFKDFDYTIVKSILTEIAKHKTENQQVVLLSTVMPGTIKESLSSIINNLIYSPSLIALETVAEDFENPEMVMIGHNNNPNLNKIIEFYETIAGKNFHRMIGTWEEAEITKIMYNSFLTTKITFANVIRDIANKIGNVNTNNITNALSNCNRKISAPSYFEGGMGIAGPCFPRDVIAMSWFTNKLDLNYDFFSSLIRIREIQAKSLAEKLCSYNLPVVILGKGYKKNSNIVSGSYSLLIGHYVKELGGNLFYHDPHNDEKYDGDEPVVYLISYHHDWISNYNFIVNSIVIDPWQKNLNLPNVTVINY